MVAGTHRRHEFAAAVHACRGGRSHEYRFRSGRAARTLFALGAFFAGVVVGESGCLLKRRCPGAAAQPVSLKFSGDRHRAVATGRFGVPRASMFIYLFTSSFLSTSSGTNAATPLALRDSHWFTCFGRLKAGVSVSQAEAELKTIHDNLLSHYPGVNIGYGLRVFPLLNFIVNGYSMTIWLLAAAVSVLLLVSCLNVANLLFARGLYRRHEMMIRATLGASRWQVIRQLLLETILLTAVGGVVGLFVAQICVQGTRSLMPADLYRLQELHVDSNTLGFIFALILITSLLSGLLPAWSLSQVVLAPGLKDEGGRTGTGGPQRIQSGLVTAQVALTCVLLIAAGLLIRSFHATQTVKLGFNPSHLFTAGINLTSVKYENDDVKTHAFWDELMTKIRRIPSVTDAALNNNPPLKWDRGNFSPFTVDGQPNPEPDHEPILTSQTISSDYFRTMQIPILQGWDFDSEDKDDKPNVVVVDEALAKHYFPDQQIDRHRTSSDLALHHSRGCSAHLPSGSQRSGNSVPSLLSLCAN